jgi:hypothetical protein
LPQVRERRENTRSLGVAGTVVASLTDGSGKCPEFEI